MFFSTVTLPLVYMLSYDVDYSLYTNCLLSFILSVLTRSYMKSGFIQHLLIHITQFIMHIFRRATSNMLCCFGPYGHDDLRQPSSPQKPSPDKDTPISMSVHGASVPHTLDSPDALHRIFASNASQRGYNAVQTAHPTNYSSQGSLDFNFRFGVGPSQCKPHGRLEQLTQHVKQKLSESRLSAMSIQGDNTKPRPVQLSRATLIAEPDATTQLIGRSQTSIGLTDLLASRAASEGGYDSDAKSIRTPTILSARDTFRLRTKTVRQPVIQTGCINGNEKLCQPSHSANSPSEVSSLLRKEVSTSSRPLEVPQAISFWEALQIDPSESRGDSMSPSGNSIALRTINATGTPELQGDLVHNDIEKHSKEGLPLPFSQSDSTDLNKNDNSVPDDLIKENEYGTTKKTPDHPPGIVLNCTTFTEHSDAGIDPSPLSLDRTEIAVPPCIIGQAVSGISPATVTKVATEHVSDEAISKGSLPLNLKRKNLTKSNMNMTVSSDQQSLHLFNMRISQRLASSSRMPMLSSTNISNKSSNSTTSIAQPKTRHQRRTSSLSRGPTFINVEHNRCPSDPETKKLFEELKCPPGQGKRSFSDGSVRLSNEFRNEKTRVIDDSSSYYGSMIEGTTGDRDLPVVPKRRGSLVNTNSFAVGGRSASGPMVHKTIIVPSRCITDIKHNQTSKDGAQDAIAEPKRNRDASQIDLRNRGVGISKPSKFIKIDSTPTPVARRFQSLTDANETLSEIGIGSVIGRRVGAGTNESSTAVKDRRNEDLSEIDPCMLNLRHALQDPSSLPSESWLSQAQQAGWRLNSTGNEGPDTAKKIDLSNKDCFFNRDPVLGWQENTSEIWLKAFKSLGGSEDRGILLETPQFDREGRRKSSVKSVSDLGLPIRSSSFSSGNHRRSQSVDTNRHERMASLEAEKKRRKSIPIFKDFGLSVPHKRSYILASRSRLKKSSLLNLGHRVIATDTVKVPKDTLGIWGRFASHTREQRNGPAGLVDNVKVRDFCGESNNDVVEDTPKLGKKSTTSKELHSRGSWNLHKLTNPALKGQNTKSMTIGLSSAERAKQRRKGMIGRFRRIYRTKSLELQTYITQGHRGSVSTGLSAEYPELECLPGETAFAKDYNQAGLLEFRTDGTTDRDGDAYLDTISEVTSKKSRSMRSYTLPWRKRDAEEWSKLYQDCVGSLSALKSNDEVQEVTQDRSMTAKRRTLSSKSVLRDSTVDFEANLRKDAIEAKERLLQQLQSSDGVEENFRMPGSFV